MSTATIAVPISSPPVGPAAPTGPTPYRFSLEDYHKMITTGIFDDKRVEWIEGQVIEKMATNPPHDGTLTNVEELIRPLLSVNWHLRGQMAVTLSGNQPIPDVAVVVGNRRSYLLTHPSAAQVGLLVEVADSTLASDRTVKGPMYARDNIEQYWIVNILDRQIEIYTQPSGTNATPEYGHGQVYRSGDAVPLVFRGVALGTITVDELLP